MQDKKLLKKMIKEYFTDFAKNNDLFFLQPDVMARLKSDIIYFISFNVHIDHFNCDIAIMPLYVPSEGLTLNFGSRINYFRTKITGNWGYGGTKESVEYDLNVIRGLIEKNVLPWFEEVNTPEKLLNFMETKLESEMSNFAGFTPFIKFEYMGYISLYLKHYEKAIGYFNKELLALKDYFPEFQKQKKEEVMPLIELVKQEKIDEITAILNQNIEFTKRSIKLKN